MIKVFLIDSWGTIFLDGRLNEDLLEFVRANQERFTFVVVSQAIADLDKIYKDQGIEGLFQRIVTSGATGLDKRNPAIYQFILNELKLKPEEVVLIDDQEDYLAPAASLGIKTILYRAWPSCSAEIGKLLVSSG
jgi:FMN phosphatase YigB (HAD superfamily)